MDEHILSLTDQLALKRTQLANERTLLAYLRTFIGLVASGAAMWKLIDMDWAKCIAVFFFSCAPITIGTGFYRFFQQRNNIKNLIR